MRPFFFDRQQMAGGIRLRGGRRERAAACDGCAASTAMGSTFPKRRKFACAAGGQEEGNLAVFSLLSITLFPLSLRWRPGCYAPLLRTGTAAKEIRGAEAEGICADGFASYSRKSGCILSGENAGVYVGKVGASCPVRDFGVRAGRLFCSCGLGGNRKQVLSLCAQRAPLKKEVG